MAAGSVMGILAGQAHAFEQGDVYLCPSAGPNMFDVHIWIGRIDTFDGNAIVGAAIRPTATFDGPIVGHAPFSIAALESCEVAMVGFDLRDRAHFDEGYQTWRTAFEKSEAGYWNVPPSEAYSAILEIIDQ